MPPSKLYIFDLDGTLYRGSQAIAGASQVVRKLQDGGSLVRYLTNNSSQSRQFYADKLTKMGFPALQHEIYSSAIGAAVHLKSVGHQSAMVVGMPGLIRTLEEASISVTPANGHPPTDVLNAVVVGLCLDFTYPMMAAAMNQILKGAEFIATNRDATFPIGNGQLTPGAGSIVAAIETCSGTPPFTVGKPNPFLVNLILSETGIAPDETLVVGDRLDTDIASGIAAGCHTHLVMTGVETVAPEGQRWSRDVAGVV